MRTNLILPFLLALTVSASAQILQRSTNEIDNRFVDEYGDSTSVYTKEIEVELSEQEASLVIQAISKVRLAAEFTADEQLALKQVAEKLSGRVPAGDDNGSQEGTPESNEGLST